MIMLDVIKEWSEPRLTARAGFNEDHIVQITHPDPRDVTYCRLTFTDGNSEEVNHSVEHVIQMIIQTQMARYAAPFLAGTTAEKSQAQAQVRRWSGV